MESKVFGKNLSESMKEPGRDGKVKTGHEGCLLGGSGLLLW